MNAGRLGSTAASNARAMRRISALTSCAVVATVMLFLLASWLPAQSSPRTVRPCAARVMPGMSADVIVASGAIGAELATMRRGSGWTTMRQDDVLAIAADPSSHLHAVGSYHLARRATDRLASCGTARAAATGAAWALAIGVAKEVVDGWYTGFSTVDLAVDAAGVGYAMAQAAVPSLAHITPTISVSPQIVRGPGGMRGALTNYAQQTVWLSANVHELLPRRAASVWPSAVRLSVGRRAFGGAAASEYVVGLDLDANALPGSHPAWQRLKRALHHARLPGPAVVLRQGGASAVALYW